MNSILSGCRRRNSLSLIIVAVAIGVGIRSVAQNSDSGSGINSSASAARPGNERLNFQADLFTGRFAYSVPIVIAPARQGAQPALALAYNSAGGNGWCGVGWSLNRVRDVNGNETYLSYMNEGNELYITAIRYNANVNVPALPATHTVEFQLEDRNDRSFSFQAGYRVAQNKRLSQIQVRVSGDPVRRYALGYTYSPSTGRSLLTGVTEFGADDISSLPPTTFDYQVKPTGFETGQTWGPVGTPNWTATDRSW